MYLLSGANEILDELRPDVQTKFTALQTNADKYSKILKIATKYDKGTSAFNYFFDRDIFVARKMINITNTSLCYHSIDSFTKIICIDKISF